MGLFQSFALVLTVTALFGFVNERWIKLPTPIGVTLVALLTSLGLLLFRDTALTHWAQSFLGSLNFDALVLQGLLSFLLFAGSLHVNLEDLGQQGWPIVVLATVGVLISTVVVGFLAYLGAALLGYALPLTWAFVFGALISPTDPIAVLGILRRLGVRHDVETLVVGESLFNDGVGVVVFLAALNVATASAGAHGGGSAGTFVLFAREAFGGLALGFVLGVTTYLLLRAVDQYTVEVLLTLALVAGGYALADTAHVSGPLAMVVAGLFIGNRGRMLAMSTTTREHLDTFWELVDEILNAVLFVLIGLEVLVLARGYPWPMALLAIPLVLVARFVSAGAAITTLRARRRFPPWTVRTMVWGGLRGGISVALALSLPIGHERDLIVSMTYAVVVFSILVQGLTVSRVARRIPAEGGPG
ncbi:MAG: sodium:proton antiporter [Deinococcales bacterium]